MWLIVYAPLSIDSGHIVLLLSVCPKVDLKPKRLTHYQTTNFRLSQTERVCRQRFQIWRKWQKAIQTGRKHWEKEKLLVTSNFSFSHSVFKRLVSQGRQKVSLCGNGLTVTSEHSTLHQTTIFRRVQIESICRWQNECNLKREILRGIVRKHGKRRKYWLPAFSPFPQCFSKGFFFPGSLTLSQTSPGFYVSVVQVLKTLWEMEKLLVTSNFSFSHSVFYPSGDLSAIFIKFEIVVCKLFQFGRV